MAMGIALSIGDNLEDTSDLPDIPKQVISKDGQIVDTGRTVWKARVSSDGGKFQNFNWELLDGPENKSIFTKRALHLIKLYVADRITKQKVGTAKRDYDFFLSLNKWLKNLSSDSFALSINQGFGWFNLTEDLARRFLNYDLNFTSNTGIFFYKLRGFYKWGVARQYRDFTPHTYQKLKSMSAKRGLKGHHVRFRHPTKGPFSTDEKFLITKAIDACSGMDKDRAIVMLHLELGCNPNAIVRLKNKDFKRYDTGSTVVYQLDVPRLKKGTTQRETITRPITNKLGQLIERLMQGEPESPLLHWLAKLHPERTIDRAMQRFSKSADLISPRTKKRLDLHPRRFRCTLASHMAEEGASKHRIAAVLDHSSLRNVEVYVETASSIADAVATATDAELIPLVNRFLGKIVDSLKAPAFEGLPNQIIPGTITHLPNAPLNVGGIGACGRDVRKDGLCGLFPPLSCYLCPSFAALANGNHKELLDYIETYMREEKDQSDKRIMMQLDSIKFAIKQVVLRLSLTQVKTSNTPEAEER